MADIYAGADADHLVTGEAVTLDLPPASIGVRLLSGLVDLILELILLVGGVVATATLASDEATAAVGIVLSIAVATVLAPAALETLTRGKSVGKYALATRTVRTDAGPISARHAVVRALVGFVELWALSGVPALISALVSPKGQRVGDHVAGTYVVRDKVELRLPPAVSMPPHLAGWAASADIAPLPIPLAVAMRQLLGRADTLAPQARAHLVADLARRALDHVSPPPPHGTPPDLFLAAVLAERRRRDEQRLAREGSLRQRLSASLSSHPTGAGPTRR